MKKDFLGNYVYSGTISRSKYSQELDTDFILNHFAKRDFLQNNLCLPLKVIEEFNNEKGPFIEVAITNSQDIFALSSELSRNLPRAMQKHRFVLRICPENIIIQTIDYVFTGKEIKNAVVDEDIQLDDDNDEVLDLDLPSAGTTVDLLIHQIFKNAIYTKASDIHIEPTAHVARVRYRQDGVLHIEPGMEHIGRDEFHAVVNRLKIEAGKDIAENRLPQDGGFFLKFLNRRIDVRFSSLPTVYGEKIVMRLLDTKHADKSMDEIIWDDGLRKIFLRSIESPHGILLVSGPTGCGKTTTLHNALLHLHNKFGNEKNIVTVEDPVEYRVNGVCQVEAKQQIGLTFSRALRSIVRQDPDIILIGEIRDEETVNIAIQSAMTGHLVLSTVHTNEALGAISRLKNLGARPYLIAETARLLQAQRLVRRLCEYCTTEVYDREELQAILHLKSVPDRYHEPILAQRVMRPNLLGCDYCHNSGYKERLSVMEMVVITHEMKALIAAEADVETLGRQAVRDGFRPMFEYGLDLVFQGKTSLDEALGLLSEQ
jgi:type II secretory ATPase GspE/PulE/Tfp pilus assembly ATPase PilB-like protein